MDEYFTDENTDGIKKLENIPNSNRIIIISKDIKINNVEKKHIKEVMESYSYKDLADNSKLKKKVFIIVDTETLWKKYMADFYD